MTEQPHRSPLVEMTPSREQVAQAQLAQHDILETINRLLAEGMDPDCVLNALAAAIADTIACFCGVPAVVPWLEMNARNARNYIEGR